MSIYNIFLYFVCLDVLHGVIYIATNLSYLIVPRTIFFERALRINNDKVLG